MIKADLKKILAGLSAMSYRITPIRSAIIGIFVTRGCRPISAKELTKLLAARRLSANKTTVYRELEFLLTQELIRKIRAIGVGAYYEFNADHHHHFICTRCHSWSPVQIDESFIAAAKNKISRQKIAITDHLLEFFGLCAKCNKSV